MAFPTTRMRRMRRTPALRQLVREHRLHASNLIAPLFVTHGSQSRVPIDAIPGHSKLSIDLLVAEADRAAQLGLGGVLLFGIPADKDEAASEAYDDEGIVQLAVRAIRERTPELTVMTDVCLCQYTSHGHCGIVAGGEILNDVTLELLAKTAVSHVQAGAHMVAPSDMMDGRVGAIRAALDGDGFEHIPIMSYSVKYASAFYGPFREAADSSPVFGDRRAYQMDPANIAEALREARLDVEEGADVLMVKPALAYLDVLSAVKREIGLPTAAYSVSGEYAMVKAAAQRGWIDEQSVTLEMLTSIKRAGADAIITYAALEAASWLQEQK